MTNDLLNYGPTIKRYQINLSQDDNISPENKEAIGQYFEKIKTRITRTRKPVQYPTLCKDYQDAYYITRLLGKQSIIDTLQDKAKLEELRVRIMERWPHENSFPQRLKALRKIGTVLLDEMPKHLLEMKTGMVGYHPPSSNELLTKIEEQTILDKGATTTKHKAIVSCLREGLRTAELYRLHYEDLFEDGDGRMIINVRFSKTGKTREVPTRRGLPYLKRWLLEHPTKNGLLFANRNGKRLTAAYMAKINRQWFERAGINPKRSRRPYYWRKASITNWCKDKLPLDVGAVRFNTSLPQMQRTYNKVNTDSLNEAADIQAGIEPKKSINDAPKEVPITCPRCENVNEYTAKKCWTCGWELSKNYTAEMNNRMALMEEQMRLLEKAVMFKLEIAPDKKIDRSILEELIKTEQ